MKTKAAIFLEAKWEYLAMINYEVSPEVLLPHLPYATELDTYNNKTLVSIVGFMFNNTKVFGLRWPFHTDFEEVNLRFYVKHFDGNTWKRGVVFFSEIVPRRIIATMANLLYREHYSTKPMTHQVVVGDEEINVKYKWKHLKKWNGLDITADTSLSEIKPGSEEEFILEHYWGYNKYDAKTTIEYGVEHEMWQVHAVKQWNLDCDVAALYGQTFVPYLTRQPSSVFLAKGSEVVIRRPGFIREPNRV